MKLFGSSFTTGFVRLVPGARRPARLAFASLMLFGCHGVVGDEASTVSGNAAGATGEGGDSPSQSPPPPSSEELVWPASFANKRSLLRRLSRDEITVSLTALVGSAPAREDLPEEQRPTHSSLLLSGNAFIDSELGKLRQVMGSFATKVAPAVFTKTSCSSTGRTQQDCLTSWSKSFFEAAFRRPLRSDETMRLPGLFALAGVTKDDDVGSVEAALKAALFSPSFLYRAELGAPVANAPRMRALNQREIATRLAYLATLGPPDGELKTASEAGKLSLGDERARQFTRLIGTAAGKRAAITFVLEWLGANEPKIRQKSAKYLSGLSADIEPMLRQSAESAIGQLFNGTADASFAQLLTSNAYISDAAVKKITDAVGTATGDTAETQRMGLMMHPHVLASHTKEDGASPFQLGSFMKEVFLCEKVPTPSADLVAQAKTDVPVGATMRENLEYRTSSPICASCHSLFAPIGYAFLPFDPVGRWTRQDSTGKSWNLTGSIETSNGPALTFSSPAEFMQKVAQSKQAQGCFAEAMVQWSFGRKLVDEDGTLVRRLNELVKRNGANVMELFKAIVSSPEFTTAVAPE